MTKIYTNIKAYTWYTILLLSNDIQKNDFLTGIVNEIDRLEDDTLTNKKYISTLAKILANLNMFIKTYASAFTSKELTYLKALRNYFMQIKSLILTLNPENPFLLIKNLNNDDFKQELVKISNNSGVIKGTLKQRQTGEIIETERKVKNAKLDFFDKKYAFTFLIKKQNKKAA